MDIYATGGSIDALKTQKGNTALYVARELKFGLVLQVTPVLSADHRTLERRVLQPIKALGYRIRGVVSDDERALLLAVAHVFPGVRHQTCQVHCLCEAAIPIVEADQAFKKALKQAIRAPFYTVCCALNPLTPEDPRQAVLSTYAELIRATLTEGSKPPFALGGLRIFEDLTRLEASLKRSQKKGAIPSWLCCRPWSNGADRLRRSIAVSNANGTGWSSWSDGSTRPKTVNSIPRSAMSNARSRIFWRNWKRTPDTASMRPRWSRISTPLSGNAGHGSSCYAWPERYRTNNDLETFFGRLRTRQRQIHGRKSVHEFILRYGQWAVFIDPTETYDQVLHRFQQFDQAKFDQEHARFLKAQRQLQVLHRFRHHPRCCQSNHGPRQFAVNLETPCRWNFAVTDIFCI